MIRISKRNPLLSGWVWEGELMTLGEARAKLATLLEEVDHDSRSLCIYREHHEADLFLYLGDKPIYKIVASGDEFAVLLKEVHDSRGIDCTNEGMQIYRRQPEELREAIVALVDTWEIPADEFLRYAK